MTPPRIGITRSLSPKLLPTAVPFTYQRYHDRVSEAGGLPVDLAPTVVTDVAAALAGLDGLLVTGGPDIDPARYVAEAHPRTVGIDAARDDLEFALLDLALARDLPVLAICRGQQALNVALGGGLVQHIEQHVDPDGSASAWHEVTLTADSTLARLLGATEVRVNSRHHQAADPTALGTGLVVTARAPDGVIEGLASVRHRWVVGVQWHPEREEVAAAFQPLFAAFVQVCAGAPVPG